MMRKDMQQAERRDSSPSTVRSLDNACHTWAP